MSEIVSGLFGVNPQQLAQQRQAIDTANAFKFANLDQGAQAQFNIARGAAGLGRVATNLLGGDPEMQKVSAIKSLSNQFDLTSATGMRDFARSLQQQFPQEAMMAAKRADEMDATQAKTAAIPAALEQQREIAMERIAAQREAIEARREAAEANRQARLEAAADRRAMQQESLNVRRDATSAKEAEKADKRQQAAEAAIAGADRVINTVQDAKGMVSSFTAGAGGLLAAVPMTKSKDLSAKLTSIKANLGFDRLQQMRDASPTGGALGQVAVQELVALQSTIASLDQMQSPAQLQQALNDIERHYTNWRNASLGKLGREVPSADGSAAQQEIDFSTLPKRK